MDEPKEFSHEWFLEASNAWKENKKKKGASYVYICQYIQYGKKCGKEVYKMNELCINHWAHS